MNKLTGTILTLPKMSGNVGAKTIYIGGKGDDGATFIPSVSADGIISWTNDKDLPNPEPVNIKGTKGDKGDKGDRGLQGVQGIQGERGEQGQKGDKGDRGEQGIQGIQGAKGETGAQGQKGADGTPATHRWSGTTLYITSASGTSSADLKGEKGDRGEKGDKGADGTMTFEDLTAEQKASLKGDKGDKGDPGTNGKDGYTPVKGVDYFDGQPGKDGADGAPGADGAQGKPGKDGTDGKSAYAYAQDGGYTGTEEEFAAKLADIPLAGSTEEVTPSQVYAAIFTGQPIALTRTDPSFGEMAFNNFAYSYAAGALVISSTTFKLSGVLFCAQIVGSLASDAWTFSAFGLAQSSDIPSVLPNPNLITFKPGVNLLFSDTFPISYSGESAQTVYLPTKTSHLENDSGFVTEEDVDALITAKLAEITNAEEVAF